MDGIILRKDIDSGQVTSEKNLRLQRVPYTHEHALYCVLDTHNNTYSARQTKNARKQVKLSAFLFVDFRKYWRLASEYELYLPMEAL